MTDHPDQICATCLHSSVPDDELGAAGWLNCALAEKWNYRAAPAACSFEPSRYQPKAAAPERVEAA